MRLQGRHIVVGVGGGIAAYKAVELVRALQREGAEVRAAMTTSGMAFIQPLTLEALTRCNVLQDVMSLGPDKSIEHVEWGHWADLLVVAPATADLLARLAAGMANDAVTSLALCMPRAPLVCPAMEPRMWNNAATKRNLHTLREGGAIVVEPEEGALASGRSGVGRLADPAGIVERVCVALGPHNLHGRHVLVTAGPTQEALDPVRFISNRSSGKMGVALAEAARARGAHVTLIHGPITVPAPSGVVVRPVTTALQMLAALEEELPRADVLLMAAAVSDFRPAEVAEQKKKKGGASETLTLVPNPDLLLTTRGLNPRCIRIGFAAETEKVREHAREKLERKGLRFIVANDVSQPDAGFGVDTNRVTILRVDGEESLPLMSKRAVAHAILDRVVREK